MNRIVLVGRLVKDPERKDITEQEKTLAKFVLAVERPFRNSEGERIADFIPVVVWGRKAEVACDYLKKGMLISLTGRLHTSAYEDKEGNKKYRYEVIADEFQFVERKPEDKVI